MDRMETDEEKWADIDSHVGIIQIIISITRSNSFAIGYGRNDEVYENLSSMGQKAVDDLADLIMKTVEKKAAEIIPGTFQVDLLEEKNRPDVLNADEIIDE